MPYRDHETWLLTDRVRTAAAVVSVQAECSASDAVDRLMIRAAALETDVESVALDVLAGNLRFDL